jgi:hypothetical protein
MNTKWREFIRFLQGLRALVNWAGCAAGGAHEDVVERILEASWAMLDTARAAAMPIAERRT